MDIFRCCNAFRSCDCCLNGQRPSVAVMTAMDRFVFLPLLLLLAGWSSVLVGANQPPRFGLTDDVNGGEVVLTLKEGPSTPVGSVIYKIRASDPDGDVLQFGLLGQAANELLRVQRVSDTEAELQLIKELDREVIYLKKIFLFRLKRASRVID